MLELPFESLLKDWKARPTCIISDVCFPWTANTAKKLPCSKDYFPWIFLLQSFVSEEKFEERIKGRSLLIRGWAPQVLILSHPAIGGFLTHCSWNSVIEGISAGVQMLTWPLFADQFCNEKLIVHVLKISARIGVEAPLTIGQEDEIGVLVKKEDVEKAINTLMDEGEERDEKKKKSRRIYRDGKESNGRRGIF